MTRKLVPSTSPYAPIIGFSRAVRVGNHISIGGTAPIDANGKTVGVGDPATQLATRFKGLPDVRYSDDRHWISGNMVVSEWLLTGTRPDGVRVKVRGCDHYEFRDGKVVRKDAYWKIVEKP